MKTSTPPRNTFNRTSKRRRERLTDLERDVDPAIWDERQAAVRALLRQPLITDTASTARVLVARHHEWLSLWFAHLPGWEFHYSPEACRLVKRPADTLDDTRPCRDPKSKDTALSRRGYVFLCLILSVLLRENRQFTLKGLADSLAGIGESEESFAENGVPLALDRRESRRDLVLALRVLMDWGVISVVEARDENYISTGEGDVLYNVDRPVLFRLLAARQPPSLVDATDLETRLTEIHEGAAASTARESDEYRTREIRHNLYRRLLDDPVLYHDQLSVEEKDYWDKQRHNIVRRIEQASGLVAEIRAEGVAMVDTVGDVTDHGLPETGTDGHLTLLLATHLANRLRNGNTRPMPVTGLEKETKKLVKKHPTWRKDTRNEGAEQVLTRDVIKRLRALSLVRLEENDNGEPCVIPMAAIGRFGLKKTSQGELF